MHGAPSGAGSAGVEPTAEALDSVLSRFQDWSRKGGPAAKGISGSSGDRGASLKDAKPVRKANLAAGARELSYEQALRASSYRRQSYQARVPAMPVPAACSGAEVPGADSTVKTVEKGPNAFGAKASSTRPPTVAKNAAPRAGPRARVGPSDGIEHVPAVVSAAAASQRATPQDSAPSPVTGRRKSVGTAGRKSSVRAGREGRGPGKNSAPAAPVAPALTEFVQPVIAPPVFREVLEKSAGLAPTGKDSAALENKTIALSLRVSDVEQARIQACAARANVSVSAYLRQCALGVEELRGQVELVLGELRGRDVPQPAPLGLSAIPGILRNAVAGWFRRIRGDSTGLSL